MKMQLGDKDYFLFYYIQYKKYEEADIVYLFILSIILELLVTVATSILTIYFLKYMMEKAVWHKNLTIIWTLYGISYFPSVLAAFIMFMNDIGYIPATVGYIVVVSSIVRLDYMYLIGAVSTAMAVERFFATIFVSNYERQSRIIIPILILSVTVILTYLAAIMRIQQWFGVVPITSSIIALQIIAPVLIILLIWFNSKLKRKLGANRSHYGISTRYQLDENLKTLKALLLALGSSMGIVVIACIIFITESYIKNIYLNLFVELILDLIIAGIPSAIYLSFIFSIPQWKADFLQKFFSIEISLQPEVVLDSQKTSHLYFEQLASSWNNQNGKK